NGEETGIPLFMADRELLDIFDFELVAGNLEEVFAAPNHIALSEENATLLFGNEPALGRTLALVENGQEQAIFEVAAVYRIPAGNGALLGYFQNFTPWNESVMPESQPYASGSSSGYFLLRDGVSPQDLAPRLDEFVEQQVQTPFGRPMPAEMLLEFFRYRMQFIGDVHFNPLLGDAEGGFQTTVNGFALIGVLALAVSLANFVTLNLARGVERQREVGIRKVMGAVSGSLLTQFVFESLLLTGFALILGLVLLDPLLPVFATLMGTTLDFNLLQGSTWLAPAALVLAVGAIGGLYPALVLSRQRPDRVLRPGGQSGMLGAHGFRQFLTGFQFLIATALIVATLVVYLQLAYTRQRDHGFDARNVVTVRVNINGVQNQLTALRNTVAALPGVEQLALVSHEPNDLAPVQTENLIRSGGEEGIGIEAAAYSIDYDFFSIYNMRLLAGRLYDEALGDASVEALASLDRIRPLVINESTSRALGFPSPAAAVGELIKSGLATIEIIGVIADNQFSSLLAPAHNEVYELHPERGRLLTLKIAPQAMPTIANDLQRVWSDVIGFGPVPINFAENNLQQTLDREQREGRLLLGFSMLAVVISCLGLYGLVAFEARRRTKEIGIRKVLGGGFSDILMLFLLRFGKPALWATLLAWPLALWAVLRWLERFPYQIDRWVLALACLAAGLLVSFIVWLTVSATVFAATRIRPVRALRYE
ncbi:MAG: FtsX-like permease family protein, partial [Pseudomonadales bacterium]|nr:FtsX-like permease family protein [Pseudomonadales bacterium]